MLKKKIAILLAALLAFGAAGCSAPETPSAEPDSSSAVQSQEPQSGEESTEDPASTQEGGLTVEEIQSAPVTDEDLFARE